MNKFLGILGLFAILILASCEASDVSEEEQLLEINADTANTGTGSDEPED